MRIGSLFSGYGGLDMGVEAVLGGSTAWHGENDLAATKLLAHHWPGVRNLGDITSVDWSAVEPVDVVTGGWPCQRWSVAGKRKGTADERALWPEVARALRVLRPRYVVLENVPGIVAAGELARVAGDLAALGYRFAWACVGAAEVGAPHRRERIFIVAVTDTGGEARPLRSGSCTIRTRGVRRQRPDNDAVAASAHSDGEPVGRQPADERDLARAGQKPLSRTGRVATDPPGDRRGQGEPEPTGQQWRPDAEFRVAPAAGVDGRRRRGHEGEARRERVGQATAERGRESRVEWGAYGAAIRRWEHILGRPAPAPTQVGKRGGAQLSPWFVEHMMGLDEGHVCAVPRLSRIEQLRLLGNGVVPQQSALGTALLLGHLGELP